MGLLSSFKNLFGKRRTRCHTCRESQSAACEFPYSEDETARFVRIAVLREQGMTPEEAVKQLVTEEGWHPQSTRNCVDLVYARVGMVSRG